MRSSIDYVKAVCSETAHMLPRMGFAYFFEDYRDNAVPAARATYRHGLTVQTKTGRPEILTFENYLYAESRRKAFFEETGVTSRPSTSELIANPFLMEGMTVAVRLKFSTMETAGMARMAAVEGEVLVTDVPRGRFTRVGEMLLLAGTVKGKLDAPGGGGRLAALEYVDALSCLSPDCSDILVEAPN